VNVDTGSCPAKTTSATHASLSPGLLKMAAHAAAAAEPLATAAGLLPELAGIAFTDKR
jgi:hypothetical protein